MTKNIELHYCAMCGKEHSVETWVAKEELIKGQKIISSAFCSKDCENKFIDLLKSTDYY